MRELLGFLLFVLGVANVICALINAADGRFGWAAFNVFAAYLCLAQAAQS